MGFWARRRFGVLIYHEIGDGPGKWVVSRQGFESHLEFLASGGCSFVSMGQVLASLGNGPRLPPRAVCLHFDDARRGFCSQALPALERYGAPSTLYAVAGWSGGQVEIPPAERYGPVMSWEELRDVAQNPRVEIGCHGFSHLNLKRVSRPSLDTEVRVSKQVIEEELRAPVLHFAAPYNRVNAAVRRAVRAAGYRTLSGGGGRVNGLFASAFRIKRFLVSRTADTQRLSAIVERLGGTDERTPAP